MRIPTELRLSQWLAAHLQDLQHWTQPQSGRIFDPFESHQHDAHILAESYSPATSLVVVSTAGRYGNAQAASLIPGYCRRVAEILADRDVPAFTALFVQYFSLLAAADLKALAAQPQSPITPQQANQFVQMACAYADRLDMPINANCAAMQAAVQMLRAAFGAAGGLDPLQPALEVVAGQQTDSGFINDDLAGPSMPVAYHMFTMYLLAAAIARLSVGRQLQAINGDAAAGGASGAEIGHHAQTGKDATDALARADAIVTRGYSWLGQLLANDGMIAQYGRSRYHVFAQAAGAALLAAAGIEADDAAVRRYLAWMDQYRIGESGEMFAVTPNFCPPAMRAGFEPYATVTCYNNLAMAILLDAWAWWKADLPPVAGAADARRAFFAAAKQTGCRGDAPTGLIRLRSRAGFVLVNLLTDYRGTTPAGSLMHLRLGDDLHEKAIAPPFWADPRVQADVPQLSVWEGPLVCEAALNGCHTAGPPVFLMQGRALECKSTASTLLLRCTGPGADWSRSLSLEPAALQIHWQLRPTEEGQMLYACVPCLLWDGADQTHLRFDGPKVEATRAGRIWQMTILTAQDQPFDGHWLLTPLRSTLSTSGLTGRLVFPLADSIVPDNDIEWKIRIEALPTA